MEAQGNILKTLLIVAVIYTLALGAPVKRDTSNSTVTSSTVAEACAAARNTSKIVADCSSVTTETPTEIYHEPRAAVHLGKELLKGNFTGAVCEAVRKCLNHSDYDPKKCKLAAAAMELHDTVNKFIAKYETNDTQTLPIDCCTSTDEVKVKGPLCYASKYTLALLAGIDGGDYVSNCTSSH